MTAMPTTPAGAARVAAEAIRTFNHRTMAGGSAGGLAHVPGVYDVLAHLAALAGRLPQALDQLATFLGAEYCAGRLTVIPGGGAEPAGAAWTGLADAARGLHGRVERAWSATARLSCVPPDLAADRDRDRADDDPGTHR